jgi:non-ribosomal peptide synthetase component F
MLIENGWKNESKVRVVCGGEALSINLARKLRAISYDVWNFYGPTETTVWSTFYKIDGIDETRSVIAIGKPLANTEVYVLNEKLQQLPVGEPGELYIGGAGVAVGYLNRPELNLRT